MSKSRIEWLRGADGKPGYTINPVKGLCPVGCSYCYARRMYRRFGWNPEIRFDPFVFCDLPRRPSRIFVGSTMELFGPWVKDKWMRDILDYCRRASWLTFIFLTKRPKELARWSPFPANCFIGVSVTNQAMHPAAIVGLAAIEAKVKFISFEPLLGPVSLHSPYDLVGIQWVIIGQRTPVSARTAPKIEWIRDIVEAADKAGVPVFLKNNLLPLLIPEDCSRPNGLLIDSLWESDKAKMRQELPDDPTGR